MFLSGTYSGALLALVRSNANFQYSYIIPRKLYIRFFSLPFVYLNPRNSISWLDSYHRKTMNKEKNRFSLFTNDCLLY